LKTKVELETWKYNSFGQKCHVKSDAMWTIAHFKAQFLVRNFTAKLLIWKMPKIVKLQIITFAVKHI